MFCNMIFCGAKTACFNNDKWTEMVVTLWILMIDLNANKHNWWQAVKNKVWNIALYDTALSYNCHNLIEQYGDS